MLDYLTRYADTILDKYRDPYHGTPLFFDGFNTFTGEPVTWRNVNGTEWEPSNLASQQNLFRFLVAMTELTGDSKYKQAAADAIQWHFDHADSSGLLKWGGHCFIDMKTLKSAGPENKQMVHELKHHYPFYELMYEVNPEATERLVKATWNSHITNWDNLELSRHGEYGKTFESQHFWDRQQRADLEVLREAKGLSFVNIGNDLIYAAGMLHRLSGDEKPLSWAEFLAWQYVRSRHPETGLGAYQFNRPEKRQEPPTDENAPNFTFSFFGDRAQRQFGPEYGEAAKEAWVLFKMDDEALNGPEGIYGDSALAQVTLARQLGERGRKLMDWTVDGMEAWARYAYVPETNEIKPMFADGKDLTGHVFQRFGYYGKKGMVFQRRPISTTVFVAYAMAWAATRRESLWPTVCAMAKHFGLGDWLAGRPCASNQVSSSYGSLLFAVLEIYRATHEVAYLELAKALGDSIYAARGHRGALVPSEEHIYCRFDDVEALALATLVASLQGKGDRMPVFRGHGGYIHGDAMLDDGTTKNIQDIKHIYPRREAVMVA